MSHGNAVTVTGWLRDIVITFTVSFSSKKAYFCNWYNYDKFVKNFNFNFDFKFSFSFSKLSIAHNFGGNGTKEKADWFLNSTYEWINENSNFFYSFDFPKDVGNFGVILKRWFGRFRARRIFWGNNEQRIQLHSRRWFAETIIQTYSKLFSNV